MHFLQAYSRDVPGKAREDDGSDGHDNKDNPEQLLANVGSRVHELQQCSGAPGMGCFCNAELQDAQRSYCPSRCADTSSASMQRGS